MWFSSRVSEGLVGGYQWLSAGGVVGQCRDALLEAPGEHLLRDPVAAAGRRRGLGAAPHGGQAPAGVLEHGALGTQL
jgi:hypothetical protein